ncbi:SDR family NAD(P)-dependent oxidoreductase [Sandarakinorhabdus sp. AAP62]|uniref:SDR family NAD(P)-dependent oxidoreductase n=1 Tax=Sandarakinorhabdus sp. AAP62 TaxID=1248916 RepID=UPI00126760C4|nr:SDR family NAD(P)-dependent oxidoreductase [Sandarakinorhabdus sp. AAP62]
MSSSPDASVPAPHGDITSETVPFLRRVLITGASGAIGGALARQLAAPGTQLLLWGRDAARLAAIAAECQAAGAAVELRQIDLADPATAADAVAAEDNAAPIDWALLVAGQGDAVPPGQIVEPAEQVARLAVVNFAGPASLAAALASRMAGRGQGRILLVGSAAAFHALPHAPAYAASKAGLARFGEALRLAVAPHGVTITLVSPGFVDWAGGGRPVPKALLLPLEDAARRILAAFDAGAGHAIIPRRFALLRLLDRVLPSFVRDALLRRLKP